MHTIQTINVAFEVFIDIVNLHNQNNSEISGLTISLGELQNSIYKFRSV